MNPARAMPSAKFRRAVRLVAAAAVSAAAFAALQPAEAGPHGGHRAKSRSRSGAFAPDARIADWFVTENTPWGADGPASPPDAAGTASAESALRTVVGPWPTMIHLDVAPGTAVSVEIMRIAGALPSLLWIQDAAGRAWTPAAARSARSLRTDEVVASSEGGLDIVLSPTRTAVARVSVVVHARPSEGGVPGPATTSPWAPGRVVVTSSDPSAARDVAGALGVDVIETGDGFFVLGTPGDRTGYEWSDAAWMSSVSGAGIGFEPDAYAEPPETSQTNQLVVGSEFGRQMDRQVGYRMIGLPTVPEDLDGDGVVIAIVDTGVDATHPRLAGHVLPGHDFVDGDDDASDTRDGLDNDGDGTPDDGFGHGTVVAGIAHAVAPRAKLLPVRVLDDEGLGTASRVAQGIRWAVDHGAQVVNLSLGTRTWSVVLETAVRDAVARGAIVVVAAGNDGDRWSVDFPADVPGAIAVTALGVSGRRARFGSGGRTTTIAAPGVNVIGPYPGETYARGRGTSFAAPFASGAAALLLQKSPETDVNVFRATVAPYWRLNLRQLRR